MVVVSGTLPRGEVVVVTEIVKVVYGPRVKMPSTCGAETWTLCAAKRSFVGRVGAARTAAFWEGTTIWGDDDGGPVVGEGAAEGVG